MAAVDVLTALGDAIADRTRAAVLVALMDGRARAAGELAKHARVAPSTMSQHHARLERAGLVEVASQGRHRYFRLANDRVGGLLEAMGNLDLPSPPSHTRLSSAPEQLRFARSCYNHLAGTLAMAIHTRLLEQGHLTRPRSGGLQLTESGRSTMAALGAPIRDVPRSRPLVRPCLDWTERRDHLAGPVAVALFDALLDRKWIAHGNRPRSIRLTEAGRRGLDTCLGPGLVMTASRPKRA